jgi:5'-nucleotidase
MSLDPAVLNGVRVLVANDDGVHATGLRVLEDVLARLGSEVWTVAPETEQSAASHSLTMRRPLYLRELGPRRYMVDGTPTDCVLLAVHRVMRDRPPDLVLSGINCGGNLGDDATYSGTVAAAREGALLGFRAVALSLIYDDRRAVRWATAERWVPEVVRRLLACSWPDGVVMNVNIPDVAAGDVTGIEVTRLGRCKIGGAMIEGVDPRGEPYFWIGAGRDEDRGQPGTDLEAIHRGAISVTPLALDLTHEPCIEAFRRVLA